jgi:16S rRNA (guanine966-N2)-methyltransferase
MGERIRGALFNIVREHVEGATVCDAFAGTGAIGLVALSRGANHVTFIEKDKVAGKVLAENITRLGVEETTKLIRTSVSAWHSTSPDSQFDLIFADPPYNDLQLSTVSLLVTHLKPNGLMVLSHQGRESAPTVNGVVVVDKRSYGDAALAFYRPVSAQ